MIHFRDEMAEALHGAECHVEIVPCPTSAPMAELINADTVPQTAAVPFTAAMSPQLLSR